MDLVANPPLTFSVLVESASALCAVDAGAAVQRVVGQQLDTQSLTTSVAFSTTSVYVHTKSFGQCGLHVKISQTRLNQGIRPLCRALVSSATSHPVHYTLPRRSQQTLCCEFERSARAEVRLHSHQYWSSSHLSTQAELGAQRTPHYPAQGLSGLREAKSSPSLECTAHGNDRESGAGHGIAANTRSPIQGLDPSE